MAADGRDLDKARDASRDARHDRCGSAGLPPEILSAEARAAADFLKALGHEGRLLMLYHLCERDHTVTELEQLIMSRQAAVSQQLARLRHEKLVSTRRDGNQIIYSLADPRVREMVATIQRLFRNR
ncbi:MAG: metalloregulator ArsR/SmtB family transcription factor [Pararhodobacter sp.]